MRIAQAGLTWTKRQYIIISVGIGFVLFALIFLVGGGVLAASGAAFAGGFGVPRWLLIFLKKRRENKFLHNFPDAVDVIVRGVKAGLPLGDCLRIIASEAPEPVKERVPDRRRVADRRHHARRRLRQALRAHAAARGELLRDRGVDPAARRRQPLRSARQPLAVLRDRKKMKAKIQAMSMEAKASAVIIAALPFAVMILVYISSPSYIELLWTHPTGPPDDGVLRRVDDDRRLRDEEDDQLRLLDAWSRKVDTGFRTRPCAKAKDLVPCSNC